MAKGSKVAASKKGSKKNSPIKKKTKCFAFDNASKIVKLKDKPLKIKQLLAFADEGKDEFDVELTIKEIRPKKGTDRGKPYEVCKIKGKVKKADKFVFKAESITQDGKKFTKAKNTKGTELYNTAKIEILDPKGKIVKGATLEFVLPGSEYDDTYEFELHSSIGKPKCGSINAQMLTASEALKAIPVIDKVSTYKNGGKQRGKPTTIIVHCMCAIGVVQKSKYTFEDTFSLQHNLDILTTYKLSVHFVIDRDGGINHLLDTAKKAYHAYGHNTRTIGIELIGFADDFRKIQEKKYKKLVDKRKKITTNKTALETKLTTYKAAKTEGKAKVKVGKNNVTVDAAIKKCEKGIEKQDKLFKKVKADTDTYEAFTKDKNKDKVPLVYTYTDKQYKSLGKLLAALSKHHRYEKIASHHKVDSRGIKYDPGEYFKWDEITPYLPPGKLTGDEAGAGGEYNVDA